VLMVMEILPNLTWPRDLFQVLGKLAKREDGGIIP